MTPRRRKEVERVREEGRTAARAGRHPQTCPYHNTSDQGQWLRGYYEIADKEMEEHGQ